MKGCGYAKFAENENILAVVGKEVDEHTGKECFMISTFYGRKAKQRPAYSYDELLAILKRIFGDG